MNFNMTSTQNYKIPSTNKVSVDKLLRVGCYDLEKTIGKGNFAIVKLASNIITKTKVGEILICLYYGNFGFKYMSVSLKKQHFCHY